MTLQKSKQKVVFGAPDWVIEILSTITIKKDVQIKFDLYEEPGVEECRIIDPQTKVAEVFKLENGKYLRVGAFVEDDIVTCQIFPELSIDLREVFEGMEGINADYRIFGKLNETIQAIKI